MTPKEIVQKGYDSFATGDMATIKSLMHEKAVIKVNGMHKFSGTYHGPDSFINDFLAQIPSHFENFFSNAQIPGSSLSQNVFPIAKL